MAGIAVHATDAIALGPSAGQSGQAVILCFDHAYAFQACVVLLSICLATEYRGFDFAVICEQLDQGDMDRLRGLAERYDRSVTVISIAPGAYPELTGFGRWSRATHFRALAPDLLNAGTIIYIDADCLVHGDLAELFVRLPPNALIGAVPDRDGVAREKSSGKLGLGDDPYVNSGVLLIDAERWRADHTSRAYMQCLVSDRDRIDWPNQDTMNLVLKGRKHLIDGKWNTMIHEHGPFGLESRLHRTGIWHFTHFRPWQRWSDPWLRDLYLGFAKTLGLPGNYWIEPQIVSEWLMTAEAARFEGELERSYAMYKGLLQGLMARDPSLLNKRIVQSPKVTDQTAMLPPEVKAPPDDT